PSALVAPQAVLQDERASCQLVTRSTIRLRSNSATTLMITTIARPKAPPVSSCSRKETNLSGVNYFFLSATIRIPHQRQLDLGPLSPCLCLLIFLSACAGRCFPVLAGFVCS